MTTIYRIGMDIGGTNTDAVLVGDQDTLVAAVKTPTRHDVSDGVAEALQLLLAKTGISPSSVGAVYLGTTHATNAILQQRDLYKVGVIRIAGQQPDCLPPCYAWPSDLKQTVCVGARTINGGFECHGGPITPFNRQEAAEAIEALLEAGMESLAVVGVFSPLNSEQERQVAALCRDVPVTLSHMLGGIGFIERENTAILNAALRMVMAQGFRDIVGTLATLKFSCPLFIVQNNGCVITLEEAIETPVRTISAGPTNSFVGASRLLRIHDAIVVDIGGTSTDVGMIRKGFPKRSLNTSDIGGVRLNFPMPDVLSIALGGGSYVDADRMTIGPQSAGMRILTEARCFGGEKLTLTDVAVAAGAVVLEGTIPNRVRMSSHHASAILLQAFRSIEREVAVMEAGQSSLPVVLVGGGAALMPRERLTGRYLIPEYASVANAFGAALAEVSGVVDTVVSLVKREEVLERLQQQALDSAMELGAAKESVRVIDIQIIPYHYMPDHLARVTVVAAGKRKTQSRYAGRST